MSYGSFATAINCMDGRTQIPVIDYVRKKYRVDYVDMITESGPIRVLSEKTDKSTIESIKRKVVFSNSKHFSVHIVIVGHHSCAANPVEKATQLKQILESIWTVRSWNLRVETLGLWIDEQGIAHEVT